MFRRVLVPVDFSEKNGAAVDLAARLAGRDGIVTLIHVVQEVPGISMDEEKDFYARLELTATEKLSALGERLREKDVEWGATLVVGSRVGEILRAAEAADLIVVSSHKIDYESPSPGAGTMSYQIAVAAPCPVLLVK